MKNLPPTPTKVDGEKFADMISHLKPYFGANGSISTCSFFKSVAFFDKVEMDVAQENFENLSSSIDSLHLEEQSTSSPNQVYGESVQIRRCGEKEAMMRVPINEAIYKSTLCELCRMNQNCDVFFRYRYLCTLILEESYFLPTQPGDYIIVFEDDRTELNCETNLSLEKQLKILDGWASNILALYKQELFSLLNEDEKHCVEACISEESWNELTEWFFTKSEQIQNALMAFVREYAVENYDYRKMIELVALLNGVSEDIFMKKSEKSGNETPEKKPKEMEAGHSESEKTERNEQKIDVHQGSSIVVEEESVIEEPKSNNEEAPSDKESLESSSKFEDEPVF